MIVCKFKICGNAISVIDLPIVAADNIQTLFVKFAFSADWDGYVKYAVFFRRNGTPMRQVLDSDGSCAIPAEILSESGGFNVGAYGESDTARINSALAYIKPVEGAYRQAEFPGENPYDPSIWTQLWEAIGEKQDVIADLDTIRENAEAGAELAPYVENLQTDLSSLEARVSNAEDDIEDIEADIATLNQEKYRKPTTGIPKSDLASAVQTSLAKADAAYKKPSGGIPKYDLTTQVQASLDKADVAVEALATKQDKLIAGRNVTIVGNVISAEGGSGGTSDHQQLTNRDADDAHPVKAITGLQGELESLSSRITSNANAILREERDRASADDTLQENIDELDEALAQEAEARAAADDGKVDKSNAHYKIYGTDGSGNAEMYNIRTTSDGVESAGILYRDAFGHASVAPPTEDAHIATKKYVDDHSGSGGSKTWELLIDDTRHDVQIGSFDITTDSDGNPLRLKKFRMWFSSKTNVSMNYWMFYVNEKTPTDWTGVIGVPPNNGTQYAGTLVELGVDGVGQGFRYAANAGTTKPDPNETAYIISSMCVTTPSVDLGDAITRIRFSTNTNYVTDYRLILWGVK